MDKLLHKYVITLASTETPLIANQKTEAMENFSQQFFSALRERISPGADETLCTLIPVRFQQEFQHERAEPLRWHSRAAPTPLIVAPPEGTSSLFHPPERILQRGVGGRLFAGPFGNGSWRSMMTGKFQWF